jgi:hypothetical protein
MLRLPLLFLVGLVLRATALGANEVEVSAVRFNSVRPPGGSNSQWLEMAVALSVHPPPGSPGQMLSNVKVAVVCLFESAGPGEKRSEFYRAEAECVALDAGRADVRFYLPPELIKRDQLRAEPRQWGVELMVGEKSIPSGRAAYVAALASTDQRKAFYERALRGSARNLGCLLPQYLTPFAAEYPRSTPSFVRRETR